MYCSHCGKLMESDARFCSGCGTAWQAIPFARGPVAGTLVRPRHPRLIAGVCSGLALHYGWDISVVRVICAFAIVFTGVPVFAYLAAWIIIPEEPYLLPNPSAGTTA